MMRKKTRQAWGAIGGSNSTKSRSRSGGNKRSQSTRGYMKDVEAMKEEWSRYRKLNLKLRRENKDLKSTVERLTDLLRRKDVSMHRVLSYKVDKSEQMVDGKKHFGKLKAVRNDMVSVSRLSDRIRELEMSLSQKTKELTLMKELVQNTKVSELKSEMKINFERTRKLSKILSRLADKLKIQGEEKNELSEADDEPPLTARRAIP
mmetsp:Transcript_4528/g.6018  ORF Transcript_4528/g.6018 Transcript_4528/m.6018 type:complete len:205 (+) Transcript_4528:130-744(+)